MLPKKQFKAKLFSQDLKSPDRFSLTLYKMKLVRNTEKICKKALRLIFLVRWQQLKII